MSQSTSDVFDGVQINSETISSTQFEDITVVEEYDVNEYSQVKILKSNLNNEYLYRVYEPELTDFEELIRSEVASKLVDALKYHDLLQIDQDLLPNVIRQKAYNILSTYVATNNRIVDSVRSLFGRDSATMLDETEIENILYYIVRDFSYYGKLTPLMEDPYIEDISCNASNIPIFIYHSEYQDLMTNVVYNDDELDQFVRTLAQYAEKHISISDPLLEGALPDGSRLQATLSDEVTGDGSNFTIRQFSDTPFTPVDLIKTNTFSLEQMAYLWLAIENNKSLIFSGGTASGKTTSMNAISLFIPPRSKTITIEDTREISLRHNNWVKSITRDSFGSENAGEINMYTLLESALRQRPEYLIVGEIRGEEATTLFQAMSTGHTTYSTMHADSVSSAIHRLENSPIDVPRQMMSSLDIMCVQTQTHIGNTRVRRNKVLAEIGNVDAEDNTVQTKNIFEWTAESDSFKQYSDSDLLKQIQSQRAWSDTELQWQLDARKELLEYLVTNDITDYETVSDLIRAFILDIEGVYELIVTNQLDDETNNFTNTKELVAQSREDTATATATAAATETSDEEDTNNIYTTMFSSIRKALGQDTKLEYNTLSYEDPLQNPLIPDPDKAELDPVSSNNDINSEQLTDKSQSTAVSETDSDQTTQNNNSTESDPKILLELLRQGIKQSKNDK